MEKSRSKSSLTTSSSNPTIIGTIFFAIVNLVILSLISWISLIAWFTLQSIQINSLMMILKIEKITANLSIFLSHHNLNLVYLSYIDGIKQLSIIYIGKTAAYIIAGSLELIAKRLYIFISFLPVMLLVFSVLIIDGLVQRDIRKFKGARESTFFFHRIKLMTFFSFNSLFFIYMSIPLVIEPELLLVPMAMISGVFTMLTITNFKKYI